MRAKEKLDQMKQHYEKELYVISQSHLLGIWRITIV